MENKKEIVITSAFRTAIGSFGGSLSSLSAAQLGAEVIKKCVEHSELKNTDVDTVYMGQVLQAGAGQNPARQAAKFAGLPNETVSTTINQLCGSGLACVGYGYNSILVGDSNIVVAGGQESMSNSPHVVNLRNGVKMGPATLTDSMVLDGLTDVYNQYHMGMTAENIAEKYQIKREEQDSFAANSQRKAIEAIKSGAFKSQIVPVKVKVKKDEKIVDTDEYPKDGVTVEKLSALRPAFKKDGTVTAGNASGINDGAAAVVLMTAEEAKKKRPITTS
jgi:acetyl-CoA C-acetyltransferase